PGVLVAHRGGGDALVVSAVDPSSGAIGRSTILPKTGPDTASGVGPDTHGSSEASALRFVKGTGAGCVALVDGEGRWLAGFGAPTAAGGSSGARR
ncbi:MAG TPA: hypothetical protein VN324_10310, partial [Quisquiliibacterium sp.]|nr:hypothetical protein [Quisquiliibacterium sp.]